MHPHVIRASGGDYARGMRTRRIVVDLQLPQGWKEKRYAAKRDGNENDFAN
jgi:hypothetical protein